MRNILLLLAVSVGAVSATSSDPLQGAICSAMACNHTPGCYCQNEFSCMCSRHATNQPVEEDEDDQPLGGMICSASRCASAGCSCDGEFSCVCGHRYGESNEVTAHDTRACHFTPSCPPWTCQCNDYGYSMSVNNEKMKVYDTKEMACADTSCNNEVHCQCISENACGCVGLSFLD